MSKKLLVNYEGKPCYNIFLESSFEKFPVYVDELGNFSSRKICIVTDSKVAKLYLNDVQKICEEKFSNVISFVFPNGESSKNMATVEKLYEELIKNHFDRSDVLLALGGGVVGDLTGFAAATFLRGISFIQMPTTLLSQVDSSIGGKTGVDYLNYKNMVGAFYMPKMVYINISTLLSLDDAQFSSGMGEVIKHGLIKNRLYFSWLNDNLIKIQTKDLSILEEMVYESCKVKRAVVEEDPKELGIRAHLNFGHTIGHAIEKLSDFTLFHGQCVAIGMRAASYLSKERGFISEEEYMKICNVLKDFDLPTSVAGLKPDDILAATKSDKKMDGKQIKFILLKQIGNAMIDRTVTDDEILDAISEIMR